MEREADRMAATGNEKNIENRPGLKRETQSRITEHKDTQPLYLKNIAFDTLDPRENVEFRDISFSKDREKMSQTHPALCPSEVVRI